MSKYMFFFIMSFLSIVCGMNVVNIFSYLFTSIPQINKSIKNLAVVGVFLLFYRFTILFCFVLLVVAVYLEMPIQHNMDTVSPVRLFINFRDIKNIVDQLDLQAQHEIRITRSEILNLNLLEKKQEIKAKPELAELPQLLLHDLWQNSFPFYSSKL